MAEKKEANLAAICERISLVKDISDELERDFKFRQSFTDAQYHKMKIVRAVLNEAINEMEIHLGVK